MSQHQLVELLTKTNNLLNEGRFEEVDLIFSEIIIEESKPSILLSILSTTHMVPENLLPRRHDFLLRAEKHFIQTIGLERTKILLNNLKK